MRIAIFLLALLLHLATAAQDIRIVGYLPNYRFDEMADIDLSKLTHLNIAFAHPNQQGNLDFWGDVPTVVAEARKQGVKVLLSIGGGAMTKENIDAWLYYLRPANRKRFIDQLVTYIDDNQLDGIDVDLEWKMVNEHYSGFVTDLYQRLSVRGHLLTAALPPRTRYKHLSDQALASFSYINIMCYDLTGPWTAGRPGQHAPYSLAEQAFSFWKKQGLSADKLVLGLPMYGWDFQSDESVKAVYYSDLVNRNPANAYKDRVNNIFYNGIPLAQAKTALALREGSGVMIWELGQDSRNPQYSLLHQAYKVVAGEPIPPVDLVDMPAVSNNPGSDPFTPPASSGGTFSPVVSEKVNDTQGILLTVKEPSSTQPAFLLSKEKQVLTVTSISQPTGKPLLSVPKTPAFLTSVLHGFSEFLFFNNK